MKILESTKFIGFSVLLVAGLVACDNSRPAETAGKKIDQTVDKADKKMSDAADKVGMVIDDATITAKVKAAILAESGLKTLQINVDTVKGVVTLSGSVDSLLSSDKAKSLASGVTGVKVVENRLAITPNK
jgi:osmotically-inducible protein OsmY